MCIVEFFCLLGALNCQDCTDGLITRILARLPLTPPVLSAPSFPFLCLIFSGSAAVHHVLPGQVLPQRANENQGGADQVLGGRDGGKKREGETTIHHHETHYK